MDGNVVEIDRLERRTSVLPKDKICCKSMNQEYMSKPMMENSDDNITLSQPSYDIVTQLSLNESKLDNRKPVQDSGKSIQQLDREIAKQINVEQAEDVNDVPECEINSVITSDKESLVGICGNLEIERNIKYENTLGVNNEDDMQMHLNNLNKIVNEDESVTDICCRQVADEDVAIPLSSDEKCRDSQVYINDEDLINIDDIKEPEEADHQEKCHLLDEHGSGDFLKNETSVDTDDAASGDVSKDNNGWLYVLGHDKLKKRTIEQGENHTRPVNGQIVTIKCVGRLEDGTDVDRHESLSITLGDHDFIHAFDLCIALMDKGETSEIVTDSRFAYGELGRSPDIPPNATISYIIELINCQDQPEYSTLNIADRIRLSNEKRERGNNLYSRSDYGKAIDSYMRALKVLDDEFESHGELPEELQQLLDTRMKCYNNLAAAQMKVEAWDAAIKSCEAVLKVQPENVKALFRKGKCLANKGDVSNAIPYLKRALKLEPETKIIHQELARLEKKNKEQAASEKVLYQKMLGTDKEPVVLKKNQMPKSSRWLWYFAGGAAAILVSLGLTAYKYVHV